MNPETFHIGFLSVEFHLPESHSLKEKRWVLKSLKDRIRHQFNASVAELGEGDKWQKAVLGICMVGRDKGHLNGSLDRILNFLDGADHIRIIGHQLEFL